MYDIVHIAEFGGAVGITFTLGSAIAVRDYAYMTFAKNLVFGNSYSIH